MDIPQICLEKIFKNKIKFVKFIERKEEKTSKKSKHLSEGKIIPIRIHIFFSKTDR